MIREPEKIPISTGSAADSDGGTPALHCVPFRVQGTPKISVGGHAAEQRLPRVGTGREKAVCTHASGIRPWTGLAQSLSRAAPGTRPIPCPLSPVAAPAALHPRADRARPVHPEPRTPGGREVRLSTTAASNSPILGCSPVKPSASSQRVNRTAICSYISLLKS